jgi:ERCC4-related helicase
LDDKLISSINNILKNRKNCTVNIINDKLTLAVFSMLKKNLKNVDKINFIIRNPRSLPRNGEVIREFDLTPNDALFNTYDIMEKNKLQHFEQARSMYDFIETHVNIKRTTDVCRIKGNVLIIDEVFMIQGSSSLEFSPKAQRLDISHINFDAVIHQNMDKDQISQAGKTFKQVWNQPNLTQDFKIEILNSLESLYKEHSPEFLYYFTLHELFGQQLDSGVERFEKDNLHFKKTNIWNMLYDFQKDCVLSAIQKINKYNGYIIADSVGLGKTFEALAVIKYFEMRQDNVLVLTPAKLYDNWNSFKGAYKDSILDETFYYKIMFHTDLSRYKGESKSGWDLSRFDWSKFDLVVIDESHNFRNRTEKEIGQTRYQRLLNEVVKQNRNTKILLLSATPVNNSLNDLRNQISIITADKDDAFQEMGLTSIANLLRQTSLKLNLWEKDEAKDKDTLLNLLPGDFYKLLELVTISRSRKHITSFYGTKEVGKFPNKLKPDTYTPHIDIKEELLNFKETNIKLEELLLAVYMPMKYIKIEYRSMYRERYQTRYNNKIIFSHEDREFLTAKMHRFNLFKRLDSSVFAFGETIRRLKERIESCIALLEENMDTELPETTREYEEEGDFLENDEPSLDYKYIIKVRHLNASEFLTDLYYDKTVLDDIYNEVQIILQEKRDNKLATLQTLVQEKIHQTPYNSGNRKVLIFTAFSDTAKYLYDAIVPVMNTQGAVTAMVSGSDKPRVSTDNIEKGFGAVLCAFSPQAKMRKELPQENQVDVLIGTDCISEGQNLQDCDCVINYDIQWNPVTLIQRFGRIDRIGSINKDIKMINFFPDMALNEYLSLEKRVKSKMVSANISSTGDEDILSPEMNDISFRTRQLERLREEVIDIDEAGDSISLTDLNMNEYLFELAEYIKQEQDIKTIPKGIYAIAEKDQRAGVIFCFKHRNDNAKPENDSSLYPYYLIFMEKDGNVLYGNTKAREVLKVYRTLCYGVEYPQKKLIEKFLRETNDVKEMGAYSRLLTDAVHSIQGEEEHAAEQSIFDFSGYNNPFAGDTIDDFELISFLVLD